MNPVYGVSIPSLRAWWLRFLVAACLCARESGSLSGVVDAGTGGPRSRALVTVEGAGISALTDDGTSRGVELRLQRPTVNVYGFYRLPDRSSAAA